MGSSMLQGRCPKNAEHGRQHASPVSSASACKEWACLHALFVCALELLTHLSLWLCWGRLPAQAATASCVNIGCMLAVTRCVYGVSLCCLLCLIRLSLSAIVLISTDIEHSLKMGMAPKPETTGATTEARRSAYRGTYLKLRHWPPELPTWPAALGCCLCSASCPLLHVLCPSFLHAGHSGSSLLCASGLEHVAQANKHMLQRCE